MPKLKTNRSAAKRIRKNKTGKFKRGQAFNRHLMTGKAPKRRRRLRATALLSPQDAQRMKRILPYA